MLPMDVFKADASLKFVGHITLLREEVAMVAAVVVVMLSADEGLNLARTSHARRPAVIYV
jgi:hypothetical protein